MTATFGKTLLALGVIALASVAHAANPSPADIATARELYKQGADALDAQNAELAVDKLVSAWSLVQTPVIGLDLARAQNQLGHLVEAREAALSVERLPIAANETARTKEARNEAIALAAQLEPRIAHLSLDVRGLAGHDAVIKVDGAIVPSAAIGVSRQANPGSHVAIVDTDDGRHAESRVDVIERDSKTIVLELAPPVAPAVEPQPPVVVAIENPQTPPQLAPSSPAPHRSVSPLVWVGVATAVAGIVTGALSGAFAVSESNTVKSNCTTQSSSDSKFVCLPPYTNDLATANTLGVVSTVAFVAAGVGAALLVTGFVLSASATKRTARIVPFFGPVSGVRVRF